MRQEFTKRTKLDAFARSGGKCEGCGAKLATGRIEYHHDKECTYGGTRELVNCVVLCRGCHDAITRRRIRDIAKSNRVRARHLGIKQESSRPIPGSKASGWKHKLNGEWVRR